MVLNNSALPSGFNHRFGYWLVDGQPIFTRMEATLLASEKKTRDVRFYFNDEVFGAIDWRVPIESSVNDLYIQRAKQLRSKYDHLALFYSGGSDSSEALKVFLNNDIKLDEVVYYLYDTVDKNTNLGNLEVLHAGKLMLERVRQSGIKVSEIDVLSSTKPFENSKRFTGINWLLEAGPTLSLIDLPNLDTWNSRPEWLQLLNSGKTVGFIFGLEKPRIFYDPDTDGWFGTFIDTIHGYNTRRTHEGKDNAHMEPFYMTPDLPLLTIKQSQVIKDYINLTYTREEKIQLFRIENQNRDLYFKICRNLLYPHWDDRTFTVGKGHILFNKKTKCLHSPNEYFYSEFVSSLRKIESNIDPYFFKDKRTIMEGLEGIISNRYKI